MIEFSFLFLKRTKKTYLIDLDESGLATNTSQSAKKPQINIKVPDLISNATSRSNDYKRLNERDESDYEIDTRKDYSNNTNTFNLDRKQNFSIQMQQDVIS